jgi:hypothetical protein
VRRPYLRYYHIVIELAGLPLIPSSLQSVQNLVSSIFTIRFLCSSEKVIPPWPSSSANSKSRQKICHQSYHSSRFLTVVHIWRRKSLCCSLLSSRITELSVLILRQRFGGLGVFMTVDPFKRASIMATMVASCSSVSLWLVASKLS